MEKDNNFSNNVLNLNDIEFRQANDTNPAIELLDNISKSKDEITRGAITLKTALPLEIPIDLLNYSSSYILDCLQKKELKTHPIFIKPKIVIGNKIVFRNARKEDAPFILELRTDKKKSTHISKTSNHLNQQEAWLEKYDNDNEQVYFVILNKDQEKVGTVRLYDKKNESFCWGSWIIKEGMPSSYAIESALLVYHFAVSLGFQKAHFEVRKGNQSVWRFHERFGAKRIDETAEAFIYNISLDAIERSLTRYKNYLPNGFSIDDNHILPIR